MKTGGKINQTTSLLAVRTVWSWSLVRMANGMMYPATTTCPMSARKEQVRCEKRTVRSKNIKVKKKKNFEKNLRKVLKANRKWDRMMGTENLDQRKKLNSHCLKKPLKKKISRNLSFFYIFFWHFLLKSIYKSGSWHWLNNRSILSWIWNPWLCHILHYECVSSERTRLTPSLFNQVTFSSSKSHLFLLSHRQLTWTGIDFRLLLCSHSQMFCKSEVKQRYISGPSVLHSLDVSLLQLT